MLVILRERSKEFCNISKMKNVFKDAKASSLEQSTDVVVLAAIINDIAAREKSSLKNVQVAQSDMRFISAQKIMIASHIEIHFAAKILVPLYTDLCKNDLMKLRIAFFRMLALRSLHLDMYRSQFELKVIAIYFYFLTPTHWHLFGSRSTRVTSVHTTSII